MVCVLETHTQMKGVKTVCIPNYFRHFELHADIFFQRCNEQTENMWIYTQYSSSTKCFNRVFPFSYFFLRYFFVFLLKQQLYSHLCPPVFIWMVSFLSLGAFFTVSSVASALQIQYFTFISSSRRYILSQLGWNALDCCFTIVTLMLPIRASGGFTLLTLTSLGLLFGMAFLVLGGGFFWVSFPSVHGESCIIVSSWSTFRCLHVYICPGQSTSAALLESCSAPVQSLDCSNCVIIKYARVRGILHGFCSRTAMP